MRICLVYDHLFPQTVGGGERWMRDLALRAAGAGHEVTYLTMRHWDEGEAPQFPGVRVLGLTDPGRVYGAERRALGPPLRFGLAVARHLAAHGTAYDVVHTASFPYFPLLAAATFRRRSGYRIFVDWLEVWTREYWRRYAGPVVGTAGWLVQKASVHVRHTAFCMSRMHADRLAAEGYRGTPILLPGIYAGPVEPKRTEDVVPTLVVYAGRHVREKRLDALIRGFARAREGKPDLGLELYGDGPGRPRAEALVRELGLERCVRLPGKVSEEEVDRALARAACLATASEREGYGLVVVEAAAHGTPSVVVRGPENAALELVREGVNGSVAATADPRDIGDAILRVVDRGEALRESTAGWFAENASTLSLDRSLALVVENYERSGVGRYGSRP
jgi:glycosyltransferase involved in cell wall biosynthesis